MSCAIYKYKDKKKALYFVKIALRYQKRIGPQPNGITFLFSLLLKGKLKEAKSFIPQTHIKERSTARDIVYDWEKQSPFDKS